MKKPSLTNCEDCDSRSESVFCNLEVAQLSGLDTHKTCNLYKKGQNIFHEGTRPVGLYCIKEGKVKIYKTGIDGREQIIRMAKSGDLLGYRSFLAEEYYSATASALEDTSICFIDREDFNGVLGQSESLSKNLIKLLTRELRESENLVIDMAQKSVRERVAEVLLLLKEKFGMDAEQPKQLAATLTRDELASYVGTATETLIRLLSEFKEEKLIETKGRKIFIIDAEGLVEAAHIEY